LPALSNFSIYPPAKNGHKLVKICLKMVFYWFLYLVILLSFNILQFLLLGITIAYKLINFILPHVYGYKYVKNQKNNLDILWV